MSLTKKSIVTIAFWGVTPLILAATVCFLTGFSCLDRTVASMENRKLERHFVHLAEMVAPADLSGFQVAGGDEGIFDPLPEYATRAPVLLEHQMLVRIDPALGEEADTKSAVFRVINGEILPVAANFPYANWLSREDLAQVASGKTVAVDGRLPDMTMRVVARPVIDAMSQITGITVVGHNRLVLLNEAETTHQVMRGVLIILMMAGLVALSGLVSISQINDTALPEQGMA